MCGCGALGQRQDEHAFQPKWCSSSPTLGIGTVWTMRAYSRESGSTSTTATASGTRRSGSNVAT
jgi:hypothetical protein